MNREQAISFVRNKMIKPYIVLGMPQSTFSYKLNMIENGKATYKTEAEFFSKLSIYISKEAEYSFEQFPNGIKLK